MDSKILKNYFFNALYQITCILVPIVTLPYLSRTLESDGLGHYSFAYSVAYYFYLFVRLGLNNYGNREVAKIRENRKALSKLFFELYYFQFFMGVLLSLLYIGYVIFVSNNKQVSAVLLGLVLAGGIDLTWLFYGLEEISVVSIRDTITKVLTLGCVLLFVKNNEDVWKYALIISIGFLADQLVVLPLVCKRIQYYHPSFKDVLKHIKPNLVLFLPTIAVSVFKTMDKIMLGCMSSKEEVGYYYSCEKIIAVPLALIVALGTVMLPRMTNYLRHENYDNAKTIFNKSISFAMFISSLTCFGIMAVAREFVPIFYGKGFEKCVSLFYVILPSCLFISFANVIRTQYMLPRNMDKEFVLSLIIGALVNVVINVLLIPRYASIGAAIGTLAAEFTVCVIQVYFVYKGAQISKNIISVIPYVFIGILMFLVFSKFSFGTISIASLLIKIMICGLFYFGLLFPYFFIKKLFSHQN